MRRKLEGGDSVDILVIQMILTAVVLVGFSAEELLGESAPGK